MLLSKRDTAHAHAPAPCAPYVAKTTEWIHEGGVRIGARRSTFTPTLTASGPTGSVRTVAGGDRTTSGVDGTVWGAVPDH